MSPKSSCFASVLLAIGAIAPVASAMPASEGADAAARLPSPAVQERITRFNSGLAKFRAGSALVVAELDQVPAHAPRSEASRACYDEVIPAIDVAMDDAQAAPKVLSTGHQCTLDSDDACWMPVFDKVDVQLADVISRIDGVTDALAACRKLNT